MSSQRATVKQMALEIQNVKETEAGVFTCGASGKSKHHMLILITGKTPES